MHTNTNPVFLGKLPTSNPGEFLLETPDHQGRIVRTVVRRAGEVRAHLTPSTSVWSARFGGWIKTDAPLPSAAARGSLRHTPRQRHTTGQRNSVTQPDQPARMH